RIDHRRIGIRAHASRDASRALQFPAEFLDWAVMATPEAVSPRGVHVPAQFPSVEKSEPGAHRRWKMWFTAEPAVSGPPQSSTIFISIALGQAAGTLKSVPSEV